MKKYLKYLNIFVRVITISITIVLGLILFVTIQSIFKSGIGFNSIIILPITIYLFTLSIYYIITGRYRNLFLFSCLIILTVIILDKSGYITIFKRSSTTILFQLHTNNSIKIDFSKITKPDFERVCIFGPYSNNIGTKNVLGFKWNIEEKTSIHLTDQYNVIVFTKNRTVIYYVKYARKFKDISNLSGQCFNKNNAIFIKKKTKKGYPETWTVDNSTPQTNKSNQETKQ